MQIAQVFNRLIFYDNIFHILILVVEAYIFHILYGKLPLMKAFSHIYNLALQALDLDLARSSLTF